MPGLNSGEEGKGYRQPDVFEYFFDGLHNFRLEVHELLDGLRPDYQKEEKKTRDFEKAKEFRRELDGK